MHESIYQLSKSPKAKYKSWCYASKNSFKYLATSRTILTRLNHLEKIGYIEFKEGQRLLKRTTKKYFEEVYAYILGTKKLPTPYEETSYPPTKKLRTPYEETSPNNNSYNNKEDNNIDSVCIKEKDTQIQILKKELSLLKKEKEKERKKLAVKKERSSTIDKRDKRKNKQLPFDIVSARKTVDSIFPTWKELDKQYKEIFNDPTTPEIYEKCLKSFVETGIASYYTSIRTIDKLIVKLLEWTRQEVKWQSNQKIKNYESNKPSRSSNRRNGAVSQEFSDNIENSLKAFYAQTIGEG